MKKQYRFTELKNKSGVYQLTNVENGNFYVGSSSNLANRMSKHVTLLRANQHENLHLQNAWNKYGEENFEFSILEFCSVDSRVQVEQKYIDNLKPEYNMRLTASYKDVGQFVSNETRKKMSKSLSSKWENKEWKDKHIQSYKEYYATDEGKEKQSQHSLKIWSNPDYREYMSEKKKKEWDNPEWRNNFLQKRREYSRDDVINIRKLYDEQGFSTRKIAKIYGKSQPSIHKIVSRQTYKDI